MTAWIFRKKPLSTNIYVASKLENKIETLLSDNVRNLYMGIVSVADKFRAGDKLVTPDGTWWVLSSRKGASA